MPRNKMVDQRTETTKRRLEMYKQRAKRDEDGKILFEAYQSKDKSHQARIQPDRRWFGPTQTVQQHELTQFREELEKQRKDPNVYILKQAKLPMSLLRDPKKVRSSVILSLGMRALRKRATVAAFRDVFPLKSPEYSVGTLFGIFKRTRLIASNI